MVCSVGISFTFFVCFCRGVGKIYCAIACLLFDDFCIICDGGGVSIIFGGDVCIVVAGVVVGIIIGCIAATGAVAGITGAGAGAGAGAGITGAVAGITGLIIGLPETYVLGLVTI